MIDIIIGIEVVTAILFCFAAYRTKNKRIIGMIFPILSITAFCVSFRSYQKKEFLIVILNALAGGVLLFYTFQFMKSSEKKE